jgi:hypothetical protein
MSERVPDVRLRGFGFLACGYAVSNPGQAVFAGSARRSAVRVSVEVS